MMRNTCCLLVPVLLLSYVSGAQLIRFQEAYKVGYRDSPGNVIVSPMYDAGSDMKDGYAVIMKGGKRGFINGSGEEVIPCIYDDASLFELGLACVKWNGKYGFIDSKGTWSVPAIYDNAFAFKDGLARVCRDGKWGMINPTGRMIILPVYKQLGDLNDGLIVASANGRDFGYIKASGKAAIDFRYTGAYPFDCNTHKAVVTTTDGSYIINKKGIALGRLKSEEEEEGAERRRESNDRY